MFFLYGLNAFLLWERLYHSFGNCIFSGGFWFSFSVWNVMFLGQLIIFLYAFLKKAKLMKEIRKGNQIYIGAKRDGKFHFDWNSIYIGLIVLILICYFFAMERMELVIINAITGIVTLGFAILLNKIRPDRDTSIGVQVVFSIVIMIFLSVSIIVTLSGEGEGQEVNIDNLPVRISDYRENDDVVRDFSYHYEGNIFGEAEKYFVYGEEDSLHYYVYKSSYPMILDKLWDDIIGGKKYNEGAVDCSEDWKVQKALRNKIGTYYVRFDNAILEFSDYEDSDLSTEQIAIILDKLDLR